MMGFAPSPYMVTKDLLEVKCFIRGDRHDRKNVCQWLRIVLNLHGMKIYQPFRPWYIKLEGTRNLLMIYVSILTMVGRQSFQLRKDGMSSVLLEACLVSWEFKRQIGREGC